MKWISTLSDAATLPQALEDVVSSAETSLNGQTPDLCLIFISNHFLSGFESVVPFIKQRLGPRVILGCSGGGVVGRDREVEHHPALSLTLAVMPEVTITPFRVADSSLPGLDASPREWHHLIGVPPSENPQFIVLADPYSIRIENLLMGMDYAYTKANKVGGLASGATQPGENALYLNSVCYRSGAVGIALTGNVALDVLVAQGCRPIGKPMRVTKCDRNILAELDGKTPVSVLRDLFLTLGARDQNLLQHALFLGLVMDPMKSHFTQGDFLVRNIVGMDTEKGLLAIGAHLRQGQMVQFHLRDAQTSAEDLSLALSTYAGSAAHEQLAGVLLFSCLGRGEYLYGRPSHDTQLMQQSLGQHPIGGFFCNGEIGPVGGTTYLHGYTSCFALFRPLYVTAPAVHASQTSSSLPAQNSPRF